MFNFLLKNNLSLKTISIESNAVTNERTFPWTEATLSFISSKQNLNNIFNADEFGFFCQSLPSSKSASHQRCFAQKGVLRNFLKFTGKHLYQSLFFNKVAGLRPAALLKKRRWLRCFPVNFAKLLITSFLQNTFRRLLLQK